MTKESLTPHWVRGTFVPPSKVRCREGHLVFVQRDAYTRRVKRPASKHQSERWLGRLCAIWYRKERSSQSDVCDQCLRFKWTLAARKKSHDGLSPSERLKRQSVSSGYPFQYLSPQSKKMRLHNMQHVITDVRKNNSEKAQVMVCWRVASFPGPTKRGEGLVHTACIWAGGPRKMWGTGINVYITVYSPVMCCHGDLAHARAVCTRPSLLSSYSLGMRLVEEAFTHT